jgi:hypothetical protein
VAARRAGVGHSLFVVDRRDTALARSALLEVVDKVGRVHRGRIERASAALWVISTGSVLMLTYMLRG